MNRSTPHSIAVILAVILAAAAPLPAAETPEVPPGSVPPARGSLLDLAIRSDPERSGDFDALAASWLKAVIDHGVPPGAASAGSPAAPTPPEGVPDGLVLELILRRLGDLRPDLSDRLRLLPAAEEAFRRRYPDGLHRQILRDFLGDLYRSAGRLQDRDGLRKGDGYIRRWAVLGPFGQGGPSQIRRPFPPETGIDPAASLQGRKGRITWRVPPRPENGSQRMVPAEWIYPPDGVVYLLALASSPEAMAAALRLGGPDPLVVWVNGRQVLREDPDTPFEERRAVGIRLEKGSNRILIKTLARQGSWLWARLTDLGGEPIPAIEGNAIAAAVDAASGALTLPPESAAAGDPPPAGALLSGAAGPWEALVESLAKQGVPARAEADARIGLALLQSLLGNHEQAVLHAERALALQAGDGAIQAHAGAVILAARYLPRDHARGRARAAFEAALQADPDWLPAWLPLARFLSEDGENDKAARELSAVLVKQPGFFRARLDLLGLFRKLGWEAEADGASKALEASASASPAAALDRARWLRGRGNIPKALQELRVARELDRGRGEILEEITDLEGSLGSTAKAEEAILQRRALDPESTSPPEDLARLRQERGDVEGAISLRKDLDAVNPADPAQAIAIGRILERAGRAAEALTWYDKALEREPGDIDLRRRRLALGTPVSRDEFWASFDEEVEPLLKKVPAQARTVSAIAVLDLAVLRFLPDGSSSEYVHQAMQLLSEEAKDELASVETPGEVIRLRTITTGGRSLEPAAVTGRERFTMPAVLPGATVEVAYRTDHGRRADWMVRGSRFFFQDFTCRKPFFLSRYVVIIPPGLEVDLVEKAFRRDADPDPGPPSPITRVTRREVDLPGGSRAVIYEAREASRLEPEAGMPIREDYIPNVEALQKRTWDDVAGRLEDRILGIALPSRELDRAAAQAAGTATDPLEKARAVHGFVNDLVTQPSGGQRAVEILLTRGGDRTVLFKALLDRAGVPCRWGFLRPRDAFLPRDDGSHPLPDAFSQLSVLVLPGTPQETWVSLAVRRSPFGKLTTALQGGTALILEPAGGARAAPVSAEPPEESASSCIADLVLSGEGIPDLALRAQVDLLGRSVEEYGGKERIRTIQDELKKQSLGAAASMLFPGSRLLEGAFPGLEDPKEPLRIHLSIEAPKALSPRGDGEVLLKPVLQSAELLKRFIRRPRREHPYRLGLQMVIRDRIAISTGPGLRFTKVPEGITRMSKIGSYRLSFTPAAPDPQGGEKISLEREITLLPVTVPLEEFPGIVEFCQAVDRAEAERIVLGRTAGAAGAPDGPKGE